MFRCIDDEHALLTQGKVKGIRFATLEAICRYLDCQPGDLPAFSDVGMGEPE
ncbi:hypothetical protein C5615_27305 [Burkholderia cepacia]|uniref:HTH cro/C1-type domain-containing protein n=1 Tax=Burkholderia cepacia TaxID=292 RepID=A0A2S8IHM4_BURCE|nr:hypothetical protein C5615_27305 [Burkholderia cepacia]